MNPSEDIEALALKYDKCFNERRLDDAGQLVHPEATFHYVPTRQRLMGRAGYRALAAAWLIAFDDARLDVDSVTRIDDHTVVVEFTGRGLHSGDLVMGESMTIPATGRSAALKFRDTLDIRNGLVMQSQLDFDIDELRRTLLG